MFWGTLNEPEDANDSLVITASTKQKLFVDKNNEQESRVDFDGGNMYP